MLIKDNHLALVKGRFTPAEAVAWARQFVQENAADTAMPIEIEVDSLEQLYAVLTARPDVVLLDNMTPSHLRAAVAQRDAANPAVELEASGGVNLEVILAIAESGVERISVGALTHSAIVLDFGLDWIG